MEKLTNRFISIILILSMLCSLSVTAFAASSPLSTAEYVGAQEEIDAAKQAFLSLTGQERWLYLETLKTASDAEIAFFETYIKPEIPDFRGSSRAMAPSMAAASAVALPQEMVGIVNRLMQRIQQLPNIPPSVINCFRAVAVGIATDIVDGPLPFGTVMVIGASAALVTVVALNWNTVGPHMGKISKYFQEAFAQSASSIAKAFAEMTQNAKKEAEKNKDSDDRTINPNGLTQKERDGINSALKGSKKGKATSGRTEQRDKKGSYSDALKDFEKIPLSEKKDITTKWGKGKTGKLSNGKSVTVRPGSSEGAPTLQIPEGSSRQIEIRYRK